MARNGFVYFGGYQHELVSFSAICEPKAHAPLAQKLSVLQLNRHPLGRVSNKNESK
jgi:hypothetical protein